MSMAPRPGLLDSRRLTGPNPLTDGPGAVITVSLPEDPTPLLDAWKRHAGTLVRELGWGHGPRYVRLHHQGADLGFEAPPDVLYSATEVNEWAWTLAQADLDGAATRDVSAEMDRLRLMIRDERNPKLLALRDVALERDVTFLSDDDRVSVGTGTGSLSWPSSELPGVVDVDWASVYDVPTLLVTGSNGKTTTVRLLASIVETAGSRVGYCCTDGIYSQGRLEDGGDWSGPGGGRAVLRDTTIDFAVLEAARGGILRRGLATGRAQAAAVTNVAADHLGEWGVHDVEAIARVKLTVRKAVPPGRLVVNAHDPVLMKAVRALSPRHVPFAMDDPPDGGTPAWGTLGGTLVRRSAAGLAPLAHVDEIPITDGGRARFNVYNALCAAALADLAGVRMSAIGEGLAAFRGDREVNPGRSNRIAIGGLEVLVDFAHNPHAARALCRWARTIPAKRRLTAVGQAGDRRDEAIRDLALATLELEPDLVIVKAMPEYRRGRDVGEVPELLRRTLREAGLEPERMAQADSEIEAVRMLLRQGRAGDLLVMPVHAARGEVLELLERLAATDWRAGDPLD